MMHGREKSDSAIVAGKPQNIRPVKAPISLSMYAHTPGLFFSTGYRLTGGGPSGVLPGARELCPVAVSGAGVVAVGM